MAVAFDAISQITSFGSSSPSATHTPVGTPTGVLVTLKKGGGSDTTSVTYGGVAMTLVGSRVSGNQDLEFWGLSTGIPTGAQTWQLNASGTNYTVSAYCRTYTGSLNTADEMAAFTGFQSALGSAVSSASTLTVTSTSGDLVADHIFVEISPGSDLTMTQGADQTERDEDYFPTEINFACSEQAGATSVAMDYSWGTATGTGYMYGAINIVQAAAAATAARPPQWWTPIRSARRRRRTR